MNFSLEVGIKKIFVTAMMTIGLICGTAHQSYSAMTLKVAHNHQVVSPHHKAFEKFKQIVESRTNGELKVQIFDSHRFGMAPAYVQALKLGILAIAGDSPGNFSQWAPRLNALDLPFLINDFRDAEAILTNPIARYPAFFFNYLMLINSMKRCIELEKPIVSGLARNTLATEIFVKNT